MTVESSGRQVGPWLWAVGGVVSALAVWLLVVPWDLSEEPAQYLGFYDPAQSSGGGSDEYAPQIAVVLVAGTGLALGLILAGRLGAKWLGTAAAGTWAFLFAWRAGVSRTDGANMWPVAFIFLIGPAAIIASLLVHAAARWRSKSAEASPASPRSGQQ